MLTLLSHSSDQGLWWLRNWDAVWLGEPSLLGAVAPRAHGYGTECASVHTRDAGAGHRRASWRHLSASPWFCARPHICVKVRGRAGPNVMPQHLSAWAVRACVPGVCGVESVDGGERLRRVVLAVRRGEEPREPGFISAPAPSRSRRCTCAHTRTCTLKPVHTCVFHIHGHRQPSSGAGHTHTDVSAHVHTAAALRLPILTFGSSSPQPLLPCSPPAPRQRRSLAWCSDPLTGLGRHREGIMHLHRRFSSRRGYRRLLLAPPAGGHSPASAQVGVGSWAPGDKNWGEAPEPPGRGAQGESEEGGRHWTRLLGA